MSDYPGHTWQNGVDATNQTRMNALEQGIVNTPGVYIISTVQFMSHVTVTTSVVDTRTLVGVGGIPSGAKAVLISLGMVASGSGGMVAVMPHGGGWNSGSYPSTSPAQSGGQSAFLAAIVPLDVDGKIDVAALNTNASDVNAWVYGYIH